MARLIQLSTHIKHPLMHNTKSLLKMENNMKNTLLQFESKLVTNQYATLDLKDATIKIKDGSSNDIEVKIGTGNLTYTERQTVEYILNRGLIDEVRLGDQVPMDVSMQFTWLYVQPGSGQTGGQVITIEDAIKGKGSAASWDSSDADPCRPYAVDIEITLDPSCAASATQVITLSDLLV